MPAIKHLVEGLKILILVMLSATSRVNENDQRTNFMIDEFFFCLICCIGRLWGGTLPDGALGGFDGPPHGTWVSETNPELTSNHP